MSFSDPFPSLGSALRLRRRRSRRAWRGYAVLLSIALGPSLASPQSQPTQEDRAFIDAVAFDTAVAIEILPLPDRAATRDALADALVEINELEALFDPLTDFDRGLGALNRGAGKGPVALDERAIEALRKALLFCFWSDNAHGPLGGVLYSSWSLRRPAGGSPTKSLLLQAVTSAKCENLALDPVNGTATLPQNSRIDLWGFAQGFAVDRAVLRLKQAGAVSGWVQIGDVVRSFVDDPSLPGWQLELDATDPKDATIERLVLGNLAVAMVKSEVRPDDKSLRIAGKNWAPYLDQRTGSPVFDKTAVFVATDNAADAQGLAVALFVQNQREGEFRSGQLSPRPAVKWLLGTAASPIENSRGWASLEKWQPVTRAGRQP